MRMIISAVRHFFSALGLVCVLSARVRTMQRGAVDVRLTTAFCSPHAASKHFSSIQALAEAHRVKRINFLSLVESPARKKRGDIVSCLSDPRNERFQFRL